MNAHCTLQWPSAALVKAHTNDPNVQGCRISLSGYWRLPNLVEHHWTVSL
jgi:hypothetical protein